MARTPNFTDEQVAAFGVALRSYRDAAGLSREELCGDLMSPQGLYNYETGAREMPLPFVWECERRLGLQPGTLSRHLGIVPTSAVTMPPTPTVVDAILADGRLAAAQREALAAAYTSAVSSRRPG